MVIQLSVIGWAVVRGLRALNGVSVESYYKIGPEVSGGLGSETVMDTSAHPPAISQLHYEVVDWLGDCIVTTFPEYLVVRAAGVALQGAGFSGFRLVDAIVSEADEFQDINPGGELPDLVWLVVEGAAGSDDLGLTDKAQLVVSEAVLEVFRANGFTVGTARAWERGSRGGGWGEA
jgi:hypothetical protein